VKESDESENSTLKILINPPFWACWVRFVCFLLPRGKKAAEREPHATHVITYCGPHENRC